MVELGIDEFCVVAQVNPDYMNAYDDGDWPEIAMAILEDLADRTGLIACLGAAMPEEKKPAGYSVGYTFGEHPFYLCAAFHERVDMGVCFKFSARATDYIREIGGMEPYELLQAGQNPSFYSLRLSRIDLTADYIDECFTVQEIYNGLEDGTLQFMREQIDSRSGKVTLRKSSQMLSGYISGGEVSTIYVGSAKANTNGRLRIYDKKLEQLVKHGTYEEKARVCASWVRFEACVRGKYAHALTDELLTINNDDEVATLVLDVFKQRYQLWYSNSGVIDHLHEATELLNVGIHVLRLPAITNRNVDLDASLKHIVDGSGLTPSVYKVAAIWGEGALPEFFSWLAFRCECKLIGDETARWIKTNASDFKRMYPNLKEYLDYVDLMRFQDDHSIPATIDDGY